LNLITHFFGARIKTRDEVRNLMKTDPKLIASREQVGSAKEKLLAARQHVAAAKKDMLEARENFLTAKKKIT